MTRPPAHSASYAETRAAVADVEGWMSDDQGERLDAAARRLGAGQRIVEIGSFRGRSTIVLARAAAEGVEVIAIDPHAGNDRGPQELEGYAAEASEDHRAFRANLAAAGVDERITHLRMMSDEALGAVDGPVHLLYIDGAHRYAPALADITAWGERVADGGTMLIHDSFSSIGVTLAILRRLALSGEWVYTGRSRSLAEFRRTPRRGTDRAANALHIAAQLPWFARNLMLKALLAAKLGPLLSRVRGHTVEWPY